MFDFKFYLFFIFLSSFNYQLYKPLLFYLDKNNKFNKLSIYKKYYIIKNLIKSFSLAFLSIIIIKSFLINVYLGIWNDSLNRLLGAFYVSNDFAGIMAIPELPKSTKIHHYCTIILYTIICKISTEDSLNIGRLMVIYTIFSCLTFSVNNYLAIRYFYNREKDLDEKNKNINYYINFNRVFALYSYLLCCILNWTYHIYVFIIKLTTLELYPSYILYYTLLIPIINDDIILMKWLYENTLNL
tara:strand:+ start:1773 stop:2498 length:726 start_codon:yes stop_codon:yes gene_type:complete